MVGLVARAQHSRDSLTRLLRIPYLKSGSQGPIPATVCRILLAELPRELERDEAALTIVVGVDVTNHTAGQVRPRCVRQLLSPRLTGNRTGPGRRHQTLRIWGTS